MSKHTKGPWEISGLNLQNHKDTNVHGIMGDDDMIVAETCNVFNDKTNEANAHLIAAAPEMYEALKELIEWDKIRNVTTGESYQKVLAQIKVALAKAEGE